MHLIYSSARSVTALLTRLGFRDVKVTHPAFWRSADAVAYRLMAHPPGARPRREAVYGWLKRRGLLDFHFPLNTGDLMTVMAAK